MRTLRFKIVTLLFTVILFSVQTNTFAQRGNGMGQGQGYHQGCGNGMGQGYNKGFGNGQNYGSFCNNIPGLTDEQKSKMEELRVVHMKNMQANRNLMREKRAHLITLQTVDVADMKTINSTIDEITELQNKQLKSRVTHMQEVSNLLTNEQKVYFNSHISQNGQGYGRGGRGFGHCNKGYRQ